jgi:hypothetical protein
MMKGRQESIAENLKQRILAQKIKSDYASDDLKAAIAVEKENASAGKPSSPMGKQVDDLLTARGLKRNTSEYNTAFDTEMSNLVQDASNLTAASLGLTNERIRQAKTKATTLTDSEQRQMYSAEDSVNKLTDSMKLLERAFALNKDALTGAWTDVGKRLALNLANDPNNPDPRLVATGELENLVGREMIMSIKEKMSGVLSDADIKLVLSLQGLESKSVEERERIMLNALDMLDTARKRYLERIKRIKSGADRKMESSDETE